MAKVELWCGVYGEGSVFSVKIARDVKVSALQEKIAGVLSTEHHAVPPKLLALYLARKKEGKWLKDGRHVKDFLRGGVSTEYDEMFPWWKLTDEKLLGPNFEPGEGEIHVLVLVLEDAIGSALSQPPNKRARVETPPQFETFEDVPHVNSQGVQYVTLPAALLKKCVYNASDDLMLYCRREVHDLWGFLQNEVIAKNARGFIVGPFGSGKSVSTLSFMASLNHEEWNVVWIHLTSYLDTCLVLGTKEYWTIVDLKSFELPRVAGKKLFICLDGFKGTDEHKNFTKRVLAFLKGNERLVVCTSRTSRGKVNHEDDAFVRIQEFFMPSWKQDDYLAAIADQAFYDKIKSKLDATSATDVNEDDDFEEDWSEEEKKRHAFDLKFYYAGGSCRFMFQYSTNEVMESLNTAVGSASKFVLVNYCGGNWHTDAINSLYGMLQDSRRFPVSSYAAFLLAKDCDDRTIKQLAILLNA
ncbi:hypothetical protein DVH05_000816 [Phytophthora capsici]|nr:hypothetical protein DVH05_000816 [Phytophthora capsici]